MPNVYRSIGGRANTSGVERVDRDGQMEKLQMGEAEVTPKERLSWYNKAGLDPRGSLPEEIYEVEKDTIGNQMNVDNKERTRLPRPHQYSTESRMAEARGDKITFPKSEDTKDKAFGVTPGMVLTKGDSRNAVVKEKLATQKEEEKTVEDLNDEQTFDGNNSNYPSREIEVRKAMASAFVKVAKIMQSSAHLPSESVIHISDTDGVSVEDVLLLEKVAAKNKDLAQKYSQVMVNKKPGMQKVVMRPKHNPAGPDAKGPGCPCQQKHEDIPGEPGKTVGGKQVVESAPEVGLEKGLQQKQHNPKTRNLGGEDVPPHVLKSKEIGALFGV
jgi:hypothetical protein